MIDCFLKGCEIDLEQRSGKHPPFILDKDGNLKYPVGSKILSFGKGVYVVFFHTCNI